jgi:taurine--2-oxoglutarate transaminase
VRRPDAIAAILLESIPAPPGFLVPPEGYMQGVRALADEFGIVLILDEVMAGFGRTGAGSPSSRMAWCRIW